MKIFFNKNLSYLTKTTDINITKLAKMLNYTRQCVSHWVNSDRLPHLTIILDIASIYNISLDDLLLKDLSQK